MRTISAQVRAKFQRFQELIAEGAFLQRRVGAAGVYDPPPPAAGRARACENATGHSAYKQPLRGEHIRRCQTGVEVSGTISIIRQ